MNELGLVLLAIFLSFIVSRVILVLYLLLMCTDVVGCLGFIDLLLLEDDVKALQKGRH